MANIGIKLHQAKEFILDLIFPLECLGCKSEGKYLCADCLARIDINKKLYCALCKQTSALAKICPACQKQTDLKAIWVAADYNNKIVQELIHSLKYKYLTEISRDLAKLLANYLLANNILAAFNLRQDNAVLVPVPLHRQRFLSRGFNQSELLAGELGFLTGIKQSKLLTRVKNTATQINLKRGERQQNVKEAFVVSRDEDFDPNKKIILIDDVVTTGSTLNECASALAKAGFKEIYSLVVAQRED